jgi:hypothetical protein
LPVGAARIAAAISLERQAGADARASGVVGDDVVVDVLAALAKIHDQLLQGEPQQRTGATQRKLDDIARVVVIVLDASGAA